MNKSTLTGLSILSGVLLALPWHDHFSGLIITIAFLPLLIIEDHLYKSKDKNSHFDLIKFSSLSFLIWNIIATYWIKNSDFIAAIVVILTNTCFMSITFGLFHLTKKKFGNKTGNFSFIFYWISFEYIFLNTHLTWPWLNLGNAFAKDLKIIQWYEYTGVLGGTLWILILNLFLFKALKTYSQDRNHRVYLTKGFFYILALAVPILFSINIFNNYIEKGNDIKIALLQPNLDPYNAKYNIPQKQQTQLILNLADSIIDKDIDYVIAPETAISFPIWEHNLISDSSIISIKEFVNKHPNISFIIGASTYKEISNIEDATVTTKYNEKEKIHYNINNTALQIDTTNKIPSYYKSKLVSGVETMPFIHLFGFLEKFIIDFGGVTGILGTQDEREVFKNSISDIKIAPVICYESAFGEHVSDYVKKSANLIFVITNDGWWGNTPSYRQHLRLSQLRAIETRRSIARSANTGLSAFINQRGEIINNTEWWKKTAIKGSLKPNTQYTFYVKNGDFIGRISLFISIFLILYTIVGHFISNKKYKRHVSP
jgi:apolipoprotein N-acyltransferase